MQCENGTKATLRFRPGDIGVESLAHELLDAQVDMERDFRVHVPPRDVATAKHEVEEAANAGTKP